MLPLNAHSSVSVPSTYLAPDDDVASPVTDYEMGGVALQDASQGLQVKTWKLQLVTGNVMLTPQGGAPIFLFTEPNITEVSLAFDQNMNWAVAYMANSICKLRWYDTSQGGYTTLEFDNCVTPRMAMDEKREMHRVNSDMILGYIRDQSIYYRQQRDRFLIERVIRQNLPANSRLKNLGMTHNLRLQFELY